MHDTDAGCDLREDHVDPRPVRPDPDEEGFDRAVFGQHGLPSVDAQDIARPERHDGEEQRNPLPALRHGKDDGERHTIGEGDAHDAALMATQSDCSKARP